MNFAYAPRPMPLIYSFPPIADRDAKILILGSMPGKESLRANEYYAHPRNLFWPIMGQLTGALPGLPYEERIRLLQNSSIAVWDILKSCSRTSSLDSDIENETPNDLPGFLKTHARISRICFNGSKAEEVFKRHYPNLIQTGAYEARRLPSTSPAHAAMTYEQKLESWKTILY